MLYTVLLCFLTGEWKEYCVPSPLWKSSRRSGCTCGVGGLQKTTRLTDSPWTYFELKETSSVYLLEKFYFYFQEKGQKQWDRCCRIFLNRQSGGSLQLSSLMIWTTWLGHQPHQNMSMALRRCCSCTLHRVIHYFILYACVSRVMSAAIYRPWCWFLLLVMAAGLKDVVDEVVVHSSLVCLIITSQSEHSVHPSLTEVQGSHFIQGFVHIQPPDQVSTQIHTQTCTQ